MFTYSYYSDGIGQTCPEAAPNPWINEVFGTQALGTTGPWTVQFTSVRGTVQFFGPWIPAQINVECLPVYPSCNDVECVENAICSMEEGGPMCVCEDGYTMYEDGKLGCRKLQPITRGIRNPGLACQFFGHYRHPSQVYRSNRRTNCDRRRLRRTWYRMDWLHRPWRSWFWWWLGIIGKYGWNLWYPYCHWSCQVGVFT